MAVTAAAPSDLLFAPAQRSRAAFEEDGGSDIVSRRHCLGRQQQGGPRRQWRCCGLSGRNADETPAQGGLFNASPQAIDNELQALLRHCKSLAGIAQGPEGKTAIAAIQERIHDLEVLLAAQQTNQSWTRPGARLLDVMPCKVLLANRQESGGSQAEVWISGRLFLSDIGISFHEEGFAPNTGIKDISWDDVVGFSSTAPPSSRGTLASFRSWTRRRFGNDDARTVSIELREPLGQLQVHFDVSQSVEDLKSMWMSSVFFVSFCGEEASDEACAQNDGDPSDLASVAGCPVLADFRSCSGPPEVPQQSVKTDTMMGKGVTLAAVREQMLRNDGEWPVVVIWRRDNNAEILDLSPWKPMPNGAGFIRRLHLRLPLKPMPMAPKSTRISIVYHLKGGEDGEPLVCTDRAYSLDVPYSTCFRVQGAVTFTEGKAGEGVEAERTGGVDWLGKVMGMLKGIIERQSKSEAQDFFLKLTKQVGANLLNEP